MATTVHLPYGKSQLEVSLPSDNVDIFEPKPMTPLSNARAAFQHAIGSPLGQAQSLGEQVKKTDTVAVVTPDRTRVFPPEVLQWVLDALHHVPRDQITIISGSGSHRPDSHKELHGMFGKDIVSNYWIVSHNAEDPAMLTRVGHTPGGKPLLLNKHYVQADKKIVLCNTELHFMAGLSGGFKSGVVPALADIDTIMEYHGPDIINDANSTWGKLDGNPTQEFLRYCGKQCPPDILVSFVLNDKRQLVRFDCGNVLEAHRASCDFVTQHAMVQASQLYKVMITTNKGDPADLNLYQAVKGMTAGAEAIAPGGIIIAAAECREGFPEHGNFRTKLLSGMTPRELIADLFQTHYRDSWEVLKLMNILVQKNARIALKSRLNPSEVRRSGLEPIDDVGARVAKELETIGPDARIGVIPSGFDAIPVPPKSLTA